MENAICLPNDEKLLSCYINILLFINIWQTIQFQILFGKRNLFTNSQENVVVIYNILLFFIIN